VNLVPGETLYIEPNTSYRDAGNLYEYRLIEDFEDGFLDLETLDGSDVSITRTTERSLVKEGVGSGIMLMNDTVNSAAIRTETMILPQQGKAVFLELDYYTEYPLVIGMFFDNGGVRSQTIDYLTLTPLEDDEGFRFRKAYVSLTGTLSQATNLQSTYVYFIPDLSGGAALDGKVILDNIKIMVER